MNLIENKKNWYLTLLQNVYKDFCHLIYKKQFLFKTQQLAELEQKLMEAEAPLMQSFPGYKKISKTKLDRAGL